MDLGKYKYRFKATDEPIVVHAPSYRAVKGTKYVERAVKRLKKEGYKFKFQLFEDLPNKQLLQKLRRSEIVIDQLLLPGYGVLGIEGMATGNLVLASAMGGYNGFQEELPLLTTTPDTIYENLKSALEDEALRKEYSEKGRAYVEKMHEYRNVARRFLKDIGE